MGTKCIWSFPTSATGCHCFAGTVRSLQCCHRHPCLIQGKKKRRVEKMGRSNNGRRGREWGGKRRGLASTPRDVPPPFHLWLRLYTLSLGTDFTEYLRISVFSFFSPPRLREHATGAWACKTPLFSFSMFYILTISGRPIRAYLNSYWTDIHIVCRVGRTLDVDERSEAVFSDFSGDVAAATNFVGKINLQCTSL